jgi:tetratricopeptide (TPR) repeat protein
MLMVWVHMYRGREREMQREVTEVMALMERDRQTFAEDLVNLSRMRADHALDAQKPAEAEKLATEAVARAESVFGPRHAATVRALSVLAAAYRRNDRKTEALATAERARDLAVALFRDNPLHPLVIHARAGYARALAETGRGIPAVEQLQIVLADAEKLYGPTNRTVGFHLQNLAGFQLQIGAIRPAIESSTRGFAILMEHAEPGSFNHAAIVNVRGRALLEARQSVEALPLLEQTEAAAARIFGASHANTLIARSNSALAVALGGNFTKARAAIEAIANDARQMSKPPVRPFFVASFIANLERRPETALAWAREALPLTDSKDLVNNDRARVQAQLGLALMELGTGDAIAPLQEALAAFSAREQEMTPLHADVLVGLGRVHLNAGRASDALPLFERADTFWRDFHAASRWAGEAALWLSRCYAVLQRRKEADVELGRARTLLARSPLPADAELLTLASGAQK